MKSMTGRIYTDKYTVPVEILMKEKMRIRQENWENFQESWKNYKDCYTENQFVWRSNLYDEHNALE